jgi:uncharacterized protein YqjF (DUF2071 family)
VESPDLRPFLAARWRHLAMLNYEVPPEVLIPLVPAGTELDSWSGKTFASVVGFLFLDTRVWGLGIPFHRNFEEVNLRFYVRRRGPEGWRRGVVFVKEIVPRAAIAAVARLFYGEKYVALPMRHSVVSNPDTGDVRRHQIHVTYGWQSGGRWNGLSGVATGAAQEAEPGSEEEFITEHYWGYSSLRGGGCMEYRVEHPRWQVWKLAQPALDCDVEALYGAGFARPLVGPPSSAFLADGSEVTVYKGRRVA